MPTRSRPPMYVVLQIMHCKHEQKNIIVTFRALIEMIDASKSCLSSTIIRGDYTDTVKCEVIIVLCVPTTVGGEKLSD